MTIQAQTCTLLKDVLHLNSPSSAWTAETRLLGSVAELDSMAVVNVIAEIERVFGIMIDDDEISADLFETIGSLSNFIEQKLAQR